MALENVYLILDNITKLRQDQIIEEVLKDKGFQKFIISLNQNDQLFEQGIDSLGSSLGEYSPATIEGTSNFLGKKEKGQRFDHITLLDTGEFYKSFKIKVQNGGFLIEADPRKEDGNLFDDFGKEILGLTDENLQIVIDAIREKIVPIIIEKIAA